VVITALQVIVSAVAEHGTVDHTLGGEGDELLTILPDVDARQCHSQGEKRRGEIVVAQPCEDVGAFPPA
jgi:hypothetical protein